MAAERPQTTTAPRGRLARSPGGDVGLAEAGVLRELLCLLVGVSTPGDAQADERVVHAEGAAAEAVELAGRAFSGVADGVAEGGPLQVAFGARGAAGARAAGGTSSGLGDAPGVGVEGAEGLPAQRAGLLDAVGGLEGLQHRLGLGAEFAVDSEGRSRALGVQHALQAHDLGTTHAAVQGDALPIANLVEAGGALRVGVGPRLDDGAHGSGADVGGADGDRDHLLLEGLADRALELLGEAGVELLELLDGGVEALGDLLEVLAAHHGKEGDAGVDDGLL